MTPNDKREATFGFSPGPLMSEREVAQYPKVSVRTIVNWKQRGTIPYFRIGRAIRYSREQIDRALMERHQGNARALSISLERAPQNRHRRNPLLRPLFVPEALPARPCPIR